MIDDDDDDDSLFLSEDEASPSRDDPHGRGESPGGQRWLILIVDDDPGVHAVTRLVLRGFTFMGHPVELLSAYSAREGEMVLRQHPGVSVVLLDVIMETEDAGLRLVRIIRDALANQAVRIILRTGQPGRESEKHVLADYDINDYRSKADLTHDRLKSCLVSALSSYPGGGNGPGRAAA